MKPILIVITGPTASGKSKLSLSLAERFNCSIFNADSRQIFKEMNIGTAKPSKKELERVKHHFVDVLPITEKYNAARFENDCLVALEKSFEENKIQILSGGTGLYIKAVFEGLDHFPEVPSSLIADLQTELKKNSLDYLVKELEKCDPDICKIIDLKNSRRVIRALSICRIAKAPYSRFLNKKRTKRNFHVLPITLKPERAILYERINARVDLMIEQGLEAEVKRLMPYKGSRNFLTVGYKEWLPFFDGKASKKEVIYEIKKNSRRYAKRQFTWFNQWPTWKSFNILRSIEIFDFLDKSINNIREVNR